MSTSPDPDSSASHGPLRVLGTWLHSELTGRAPSPEAAEDADALQSLVRRSLRVLVVDDHAVNRLLLSEQLATLGLVPALAADGARAVACASEHVFDLVLMDLQMPVLDGLSATLALRGFEARQGRAHVPVVAYSSACVADKVLLAHGLNGSLPKPCSLQDLRNCLARWCPELGPHQEADVPDPSSWMNNALRRPSSGPRSGT